MARTTPTDEDLRKTWSELRRAQPNWPTSFEDTMADPVRSRLVRIAAIRAAQGYRVQAEPVEPIRRPPVVNPGIFRPPARTTPQRPLDLDRKRAAAGERDED